MDETLAPFLLRPPPTAGTESGADQGRGLFGELEGLWKWLTVDRSAGFQEAGYDWEKPPPPLTGE